MDYTSDSNLSEDTRDLVSQGLASVRRKRITVGAQSDGVHERFSDLNMDTSNVRHLSWRGVSIGDTSTHGLGTTGIETVNQPESQQKYIVHCCSVILYCMIVLLGHFVQYLP